MKASKPDERCSAHIVPAPSALAAFLVHLDETRFSCCLRS